MRMRARKTTRAKKSAYAKFAARATRAMRDTSGRTMFVAVAGVLGAAVLIGATSSYVGPEPAAPRATTTPATAATASPAPRSPSAEPAIPPVGAPTAEPAATTSAARRGSMTTITGCLAREDTAYRLVDTAGDAAPKARSWKTGFLRKGSTPIELYDSSRRARLPAHVGQRVSVTGELIDREMYVRSLQQVSTTCASKS
jgi:hypothetical protein